MTTVNKIPLTIWAGMVAATISSLFTPPVVVTPDRGLVYVVAVPCRFPKRKLIKIKDRGINPETFGKITQATGRQKWNKSKK